MTVYILENNLRERLGHFLNCTAGLKREAEATGAKVKVYTHSRASKEILREIDGIPLFENLSWDGNQAREPVTSMHKLGEKFYQQCRQIEEISSQDILLIGTALENQVFGIAKFFKSLPSDCQPKLVFNFHWENISENEKRIPAYKEAFALLKQVIDPTQLLITAQTKSVVKKINEVSEGLPVKLFPLPQNYGKIKPALRTGGLTNPILTFLGRSLRRKGSKTVLKLVRNLHKRLPKLRYLIQATLKTPELMLLVFTPGVHLCFGGIRQNTYFEYLRSADIFLLPYSTKAYSDRVSGILADCAAMGGIAIVPSETWLSQQILSEHAAGVIYNPTEEGSVENAIMEAVEDLENLRQLAYKRSDYWWNHQSAAAYIRELNNFFQ